MTLLQSTARHEAAHAIFATLLGCVCGEKTIVKNIAISSTGDGHTNYVDDTFVMVPRICVDNAISYLLECDVPPWLSRMVYGPNQTRTTEAESTSDEIAQKLSILDVINSAHNLTIELSLNKAANKSNAALYYDILQSATDVDDFWYAMTTMAEVEFLPSIFVERAPSTAHSLLQLAYLFKYLNISAKHYRYDGQAKGNIAKNRAQVIKPISRFINMLMLQAIRDTPFTTLTSSALIYGNMLVCAAGPVAEDKNLADRAAQSDLYIIKVLGELYGYDSEDFSHFEEAARTILNNPKISPAFVNLTGALVQYGKLMSTDAIFQKCIQPIQALSHTLASQIMLAQKPF